MVEKSDSQATEENGDQMTAEEMTARDQADMAGDAGAEEFGAETNSDAAGGNEAGTMSVEEQVEDLTQQLSDAKDLNLRTQAEMQNLRRRAERDVENAHKFGLEKILTGLLPVLDNLDRAITAVDDEAKNHSAVKGILEGVELTRKSAADVLKNFSVDVLEPYGEPFDPQFHEAMTMIPSETAEPNSVVDVLQKGYTLNGRLIRAAMVVVAKP